MANDKIIPFEQAHNLIAALKKKGRKVVQCHGTFDLIHPGHIVHFEEAKALGDVLVVTLTAEKFVNKGPGRPYFNDAMRSRWLAALQAVDYVVIVPHAAAVEAIECVVPDIYCKGREYENASNDVTGNILDDVATVQRLGGSVNYVGSITFSSTQLLNQHFDPYPAEVKAFCQQVARETSATRFRTEIDSFKSLKVLVIGDVIFDKYTTLEVQGLTSKNRILSGRFVSDEMQAGGALAVYRHIKEFTDHVKLASLVGEESWLARELEKYIPEHDREFVASPEFTTIVKQRFVEPRHEGKELSKLFSVNYINKGAPSEALQYRLLERLADIIDDFDAVLVMDFGHGVMEDLVRVFVQQRARFLAVNCQTNSNNHGFNILTRKYRRADAFTLDQAEINLAVGRREIDYTRELTGIAAQLGSKYAWLTRGATETLGKNCQKEPCRCAPFERNVVDTLGAGDAFCALATLAAAKGLSLPLATFMGQLAGAQSVRIVGNSKPISKARLLKAGAAMLAF